MTESSVTDVPEPSGRKSQATELVEIAEKRGDIFFHTPEHGTFVQVDVDGHYEVHPISGKAYRQLLSQRFYREKAKAPGSQAVQDALGVLKGMALFAGEERSVHVRVAQVDGTIYVDLANDQWEAIQITAYDWNVVPGPGIFRRPSGLLPLPTPVKGGDLGELRALLNVSNEGWPLVLGFLVNTFRPAGPFPVLVLMGLQGSAKSTVAKMLRSLVDPSVAGLRAEPREQRDLMIAANNGWIAAFDNISRIPDWLSDAVCRLATGGGFATRELYSDYDEILFEARRPVLMNGIEEFVTRGDLLDRAVLEALPPIDDASRLPEAEIWRRFDEAQPRILGVLLDAVSCALRRMNQVRLPYLPRMADFALWATAAEPALGLEDGDFMRAYDRNRTAANGIALEASPISSEVGRLMTDRHEWDGTATDLLETLNDQVDDEIRRRRDWPKSARAMGGALRRIAPNLKAEGIEVEFDREGGKRRAIYLTRTHLEQGGDESSEPSSSSEQSVASFSSDDAKDANDGHDDPFDPLSNGTPPAGRVLDPSEIAAAFAGEVLYERDSTPLVQGIAR